MTTCTLEREAVGLLRENVRDVVQIVALPDRVPGKSVWKVSASTITGIELVLRTGLTKTFANELAAESRLCLETLRAGRSYPDDRLPPMTAEDVTSDPTGRFGQQVAEATVRTAVSTLASRIREMEGRPALPAPTHGTLATVQVTKPAEYPAHDGGPARPAHADRDLLRRELQPLHEMTLKEIAELRAIPHGGWSRLGAKQMKIARAVRWRKYGMDSHGERLRPSRTHACFDNQVTICGQIIPDGSAYEVTYGIVLEADKEVRPCLTCQVRAKGAVIR